MLTIPYARLLQDARIANEVVASDMQMAWVHNAFTGWQTMMAMGAKVGPFNRYLKKLGIRMPGATVTREQVEADKAKAFRALQLVEARFDKDGEA